jgi:hypothetical protein
LKIRTGGHNHGPVGGVELADVVTDSNGSYVIRDVSASMLYIETAPESEHRFLCRDYPLLGNVPGFRPPSVDLPVVHVTWSGERMPPGFWNVGTSVSGRVLERQGETLQPIAGATVTLDDGGYERPETTNAAGFYMVCTLVGTDTYRMISAHKAGYGTATRRIFSGWDFSADFELTRE